MLEVGGSWMYLSASAYGLFHQEDPNSGGYFCEGSNRV